VTFSFYFVLAFMIWVVRGPRKSREAAACALDLKHGQALDGLSTRQIVVWGIIGMFSMPALVSISLFTRQDRVAHKTLQLIAANMEYNSGFIWLISIATVVMIPVMVIWLVWLWLAWARSDQKQTDPEPHWEYEYE
jgi:heme/copper-type cytochrome/quinol oxidase subunit 2